MIEHRVLKECDKCGCPDISETGFSEIHGHRYVCNACGYVCWGGRVKNEDKNKKRPPCPTPDDLKVFACEMCGLEERFLNYGQSLEVHHKNIDPTDNDRLNLWVLCTKHHKLVHHIRHWEGEGFMQKFGGLNE